MNYLAEAVNELRPNAEFLIQNDMLVWLDDPAMRPSDAEIEVKKQELMLRDAKNKKADEIKHAFDIEFKQITGDVLFHEMVSWETQEREALAYIADKSVETPFLDGLLQARGDLDSSKDELAMKIIGHAKLYKQFYSKLLGKYQRLIKALENANTLLDVENIVW